MTNPELHIVVSSSQLARVVEVTPLRCFRVGDEDGNSSVVMYAVDRDSLHCNAHKADDSCDCTARVRLCGILSGHVIPDVKQWKKATR